MPMWVRQGNIAPCRKGGVTYVLCEEEIQYWDRGLFMSSEETGWGCGSQMEFSLEKRNVRNWRKRERDSERLREASTGEGEVYVI